MQLRNLWIASTSVLPAFTRAFEIFPAAGGQNLFATTSPVFLQQPIRSASNMTRGAVISLSHGGGPMPILGDPGHREIIRSFKTRVPDILKLNNIDERPRAIVVVTAHWSERNPTISNGKKHKLYFDYGGFPPESYKLKYDAPGSPEVAKELGELLAKAGLKPEYDEDRGWDHGVFVPMLLIHPPADIPIVQLSVLSSEDPADHYKMGQALATLRDRNVAIIGSGSASFHNLRLMFSGVASDPAFQKRNAAWNKAMTVAVSETDAARRGDRLTKWREFPGAFEMHPRYGAEHFLPLIVCAGAGGEGEAGLYTDEWLSSDMYSYYWQ